MSTYTIYMAGDSTMQTYSEAQRPFYGWGEVLALALEQAYAQKHHESLNDFEEKTHRENSAFGQETIHTTSHFCVDNCAMAGRSSKSFRREERLDDIKANIKKDDVLIIQFGHNDAGFNKEERYVPLEGYKESLKPFIECAKNVGAYPILISSIALLPCDSNREGDVGEINRLLPLYENVMEEYAKELSIPFIPMGRITRAYTDSLSLEENKTLYREDNVHLVNKGAKTFAALVAPTILDICEELHG